MKLKELVLGAVIAAFGAGSVLAASSGASEKSAKSIKVGGSQAVTLVAGEDPDDGVCYLKVTLKRKVAYTVWFEGGDAAKIGLSGMSVYAKQPEIGWDSSSFEGDWDSMDFDNDDWGSGSYSVQEAPVAVFDESGIERDRYAYWMSRDSWELTDPSSWTYYIQLTGAVGDSTTVHVETSASGDRNRPEAISLDEDGGSFAGTLTENGFYYFQSDVVAGRKYLFKALGGSYAIQVVPGTVRTEQASGGELAVYPKADGIYKFAVSNSVAAADAFGFTYRAFPARAIEDHELIATNYQGGTLKFRPGREVADPNYCDNIIDEHLFSVQTTKGDRWALDVTGADTNIELRVYNAAGRIVASHDKFKPGTFDMGFGFDVTGDGPYYVGVCDPNLSPNATAPVCNEITLAVNKVKNDDAVPVEIQPAPVATNQFGNVLGAGRAFGPYDLTKTCWKREFLIDARKDLTYAFAVSNAAESTGLHLKAELFKVSANSQTRVQLDHSENREDDLTPPYKVFFKANANATYLLRVSVTEGPSLEYGNFYLYAIGCDRKKGKTLGALTVKMKPGDLGQWSLDKESQKYDGEEMTILVPEGEHTVKFKSVTDFEKIADQKVGVTNGIAAVVTGIYHDKRDPEDDIPAGAYTLKLQSTLQRRNRTLWANDYDGQGVDPADWFKFTAKDGVYNNFYLNDVVGDAKFSIYSDAGGQPAATPVTDLADTTEARALLLDGGTYYLCVSHGLNVASNNWVDSSYSLMASAADVGLIGFKKTTAKGKKGGKPVKLTVKRTTSEGRVRVRYATVAGTAVPGKDYVAQTGILEWNDGEKGDQTIEIALLPDLVSLKRSDKLEFSVKIEPLKDMELEKTEYPAGIDAMASVCTVTVTASGKYKDIEAAYAKSKAKSVTVKTETVPLRSGTFYGVVSEDGGVLTNGLTKIGSVTLTVKAKDGAADALSASVVIGGKKYAFKGDGAWEPVGSNGLKRTSITLDKVNGTLTITLQDGETNADGAWLSSGGVVELTMDVPDAKGKGSQAGIRYVGEIFRQNMKNQGYIDAVADFFGYYTLGLVPEGVTGYADGPSGNGYLTVKVDSKGKAKVAGMLADGTKVSASVKAVAIVPDEGTNSLARYAMILPLYQSKKTYCFGGNLRLYVRPGKTAENPYKANCEIVADSSSALVWNNDNVDATYYGDAGWRFTCAPVGGWYDTVVNLQAYYLNYAFSVGTASITEFPMQDILPTGYELIKNAWPVGEEVKFTGDKASTAKRALVKLDGGIYDLASSVNPCNVQMKLARSSGIVKGSFSIWGLDGQSGKQKEIKGFKHYGVLLHFRDDFVALDDEAMSAGFFNQKVTLKEEGSKKSRKWTLSMPFNLLGIDQGDVDWWADDEGWNPEWGDVPPEPQD